MASSWDALLERRYGKLLGKGGEVAATAPVGETEAQVRARIEPEEAKRAIDIINACDLAKQPSRAGAFILSGASLSEVIAALGTPGKRHV